MNYKICCIKESFELIKEAEKMLIETFSKANMWPDLDKNKAAETVNKCLNDKNICLGITVNNSLIGWIGLRPMYEKTWELHPMVVKNDCQKKGYGKILLKEAEKIARENGIIGIFIGSDDETNKTSLSDKEITGENIFDEIKNIKNYKNHPFEFYIKCGYCIIGMIPNANGPKKPDILLWKDIREN